MSSWRMFRSIVSSEGGAALYRGIVPALIGNTSAWGMYFFFYESAKARMYDSIGSKDLSVPQFLLCGCQAGVITTLITNPIWLVKTRMQLQEKSVAAPAPAGAAQLRYRSTFHAFQTIVKEEGPLALYRGITPALLLVSHGALQFVVYEQLKKAHARNRVESLNGFDVAGAPLLFGPTSKLVASFLTYPYQVVKTRIQQYQGTGQLKYSGLFSSTVTMWKEEGPRAFYAGLFPNLCRVAPASAITFFIYETSITALGRDTG